MRKTRGFRIGHRAVKLCKWVLKHKRESEQGAGYTRLNPNQSNEKKMVTKICNWGLCLKQKLLCCSRRLSSDYYSRVGQIPFDAKPLAVPKGHLAVYVGQKDDGPHRFLVPLIYFNHPLFGELLREAEEEFGFDHPGGITIPCRKSDFETVQMRIAAGQDFRKPASRRWP